MTETSQPGPLSAKAQTTQAQTAQIVQPTISGQAAPPPNELYYFSFAPGNWNGELTFEILDWRAALADLRGLERLAAAAVWIAGRTGKLAITATMTRFPPERASTNDTRIEWCGPVGLAPVLIWHARGRFSLANDGIRARISMFDEYGPIGHIFTTTTEGNAVVAPAADGATYRLTIFARPWTGQYQFDPARQSITADYQPVGAAWGRIHYSASRRTPLLAPPPLPTQGQKEVVEVERRISALGAELRARGHLLAVFCEVYADETAAIANALPQFGDPDWAVAIVKAFSTRFLDAWSAHAEGRDTRTTWRPVFEALERRTMTDIDALALGIYAHIVGDLPHALVSTTPDVPLGRRIDDFQRVNDLLKQSIDDIQEDFSERFGAIYGLLDTLAGKYDEVFVEREVAALRGTAWYDAFRLLSPDPASRLAVERASEQRIKFFIDDLLDPRPAPLAVVAHLVRRVAVALRRREGGRR
jgi:hypothetical protein